MKIYEIIKTMLFSNKSKKLDTTRKIIEIEKKIPLSFFQFNILEGYESLNPEIIQDSLIVTKIYTNDSTGKTEYCKRIKGNSIINYVLKDKGEIIDVLRLYLSFSNNKIDVYSDFKKISYIKIKLKIEIDN